MDFSIIFQTQKDEFLKHLFKTYFEVYNCGFLKKIFQGQEIGFLESFFKAYIEVYNRISQREFLKNIPRPRNVDFSGYITKPLNEEF